jgi:hypothetical protein
MLRNKMPLRILCLFLLLLVLLTSNTLAQAGNGSLELQVEAGKPGVFNDSSLASGKYLAIDAVVSIYQNGSGFSYDGYTDTLSKLIIKDLPIGLNNYEISWLDFNGDKWEAKGSVFIKKDSREKELVELKRVY